MMVNVAQFKQGKTNKENTVSARTGKHERNVLFTNQASSSSFKWHLKWAS